jgi:hypothetical protein
VFSMCRQLLRPAGALVVISQGPPMWLAELPWARALRGYLGDWLGSRTASVCDDRRPSSGRMASFPTMDDSDARPRATRSGASSVENATRELQDEMTLIAEALDLVQAILSDLVGRLNEADQEDFSEDLSRLNEIADTIRLHMNHV